MAESIKECLNLLVSAGGSLRNAADGKNESVDTKNRNNQTGWMVCCEEPAEFSLHCFAPKIFAANTNRLTDMTYLYFILRARYPHEFAPF